MVPGHRLWEIVRESRLTSYSKCSLKESSCQFQYIQRVERVQRIRRGKAERNEPRQSLPATPTPSTAAFTEETPNAQPTERMEVETQVPTQFTASTALGGEKLHDNVLTEVCVMRQAGCYAGEI